MSRVDPGVQVGGGGVVALLLYKSYGRTPLKGTRILFYGRVPNSFPPVRGTNSTTTNYITGTANSNSNEDNFRLFESIVINLTETTLAAVISGSPQAIPIHKFKPLKGTTSTSVTFIGE